MTARNLDSRLSKIEGSLRGLIPDGPPLMTRQERLEFVQSLAGDILSQASGSTEGGLHLERFDELSDLNRLAVLKLFHGLCQYGCAESENELRVLKEWWAACPK